MKKIVRTWEFLGLDKLRVLRTAGFGLALAMLYLAAYQMGHHNPLGGWYIDISLLAVAAGCWCNAGIAQQKLFRERAPHLVLCAVSLAGLLLHLLLRLL